MRSRLSAPAALFWTHKLTYIWQVEIYPEAKFSGLSDYLGKYVYYVPLKLTQVEPWVVSQIRMKETQKTQNSRLPMSSRARVSLQADAVYHVLARSTLPSRPYTVLMLLNTDIIVSILDYVNLSDLPSLCRVNSTFYQLASNDLYRRICYPDVMRVC